MLRSGFPRLSHPEVAHAIPSVGFMAQVYRRVRLLVSPTIVGVQLTDQQANGASTLYRAVIVRMRYHQPTVDYVVRRTADGRTKREIIRCLKRFLAREIYQRVMTDFPRSSRRHTRCLNVCLDI